MFVFHNLEITPDQFWDNGWSVLGRWLVLKQPTIDALRENLLTMILFYPVNCTKSSKLKVQVTMSWLRRRWRGIETIATVVFNGGNNNIFARSAPCTIPTGVTSIPFYFPASPKNPHFHVLCTKPKLTWNFGFVIVADTILSLAKPVCTYSVTYWSLTRNLLV